MKENFSLIFNLSLCLISFVAVYAEGQDEREPLENCLFEIGYKMVKEAVKNVQ